MILRNSEWKFFTFKGALGHAYFSQSLQFQVVKLFWKKKRPKFTMGYLLRAKINFADGFCGRVKVLSTDFREEVTYWIE